MNNRIFSNIQSDDLFLRFTNGEESGLAHLYSILHKPLLRHGLRIVRDEFVVKSSIQEAWLKAWAFRNRLTSMLHTYRFLRLNVTWKCYNHYRQSDKRHHRLIYTDNMDRYTVSVNITGFSALITCPKRL